MRAPQMMLRYSDDGGRTWSSTRTASMGGEGEYDARVLFHRLGSARNRVWEISITDPVKFSIMGAVVRVEKGSS